MDILITGGTGVLGSALVPVFLRHADTKIHLLIRASSVSKLNERFEELATFWQLDADSLRHRVRVHCGDVCEQNLGLAEGDFHRLTESITHLVHSAGSVKLNQRLTAARASATTSVKNVLHLARQCRSSGQFEKLDVISTVGVAGRAPGIIPERQLTPPAGGYRNTYEQAKAEAEAILWQQMDEGFPITIHRPSMIVGDSKTGTIRHFQVFYYLAEFLTGRRTFGMLPDLGQARLDIIPVDYVARCVVESCRSPRAAGRVFHLCSGPERSIELGVLGQKLRAIYQQHGIEVPRIKQWSRRRFEMSARLLAALTTGRLRRMCSSLPYFAEYLQEDQHFGNRQTLAYFDGITIPEVEDYLGPVIGRYLQSEHPVTHARNQPIDAEVAQRPASRQAASNPG